MSKRDTWTVEMLSKTMQANYLLKRVYKLITDAHFGRLEDAFMMPKQTADNWVKVLMNTRDKDSIRRGITFRAVKP